MLHIPSEQLRLHRPFLSIAHRPNEPEHEVKGVASKSRGQHFEAHQPAF